MMKRICLVLALAILAVGVVASPGPSKDFYSKESKVGFKYPSDWNLEPGESAMVEEADFSVVARVSAPEKLYAGTNMGAANATLAVASIPEATCKQVPTLNESAQPRSIKVGNNMFYMVTDSEGAAGHLISIKTYRTFHDGKCYQVKLTVDTTNILNYDKGTVKAVNEQKVFARLETVVRTLYFGR